MKKKIIMFFVLALAAGVTKSMAQGASSDRVVALTGNGSIISADHLTQVGNNFTFTGNVDVHPGGGPPEDINYGCGFWGNWICGRIVIISQSGTITETRCEGSKGKCIKIAKGAGA